MQAAIAACRVPNAGKMSITPFQSLNATLFIRAHDRINPAGDMISLPIALLLQGFLSAFSAPVHFHRKYYEQVPHELVKTLRNKSVLMVGDSMMRYHYMTVVYNLRHRSLIHADMNPNPAEEFTWGTYNTFFKGSTNLLAPYEHCDCFRPLVKPNMETMIENRFYHDPVLNITVTFYLYLGNHTVGHWLPGGDDSLRTPHPEETPYHWLYSLEEFLQRVVPYLEYKPTIFILNVGLWTNKFSSDMGLIDTIANYSVANFETTIWKTSNYYNTHEGIGWSPADHRWYEKSKEFPSILFHDLAWTVNVGSELYWDICHFRAPVYWRITAELVALLNSVVDHRTLLIKV